MDVLPQGSHHQHGDADTDLSFEALTFGEDSSPHPLSPSSTGGSSGNNLLNGKKDSKPNKNKNKPFKKDRSPGALSHEAMEKDKSMSSVYVSTRSEGERIDVQGLLKRLEQFGVVKAYYFKEKQNFGFIQFLDPSVIDSVIENINTTSFQTDDGTVQLIAERAAGRGTLPNGESPSQGSFGASASFGTNFGIPFSPSTPVTTPNMLMGGANAGNVMAMMSSSAPPSNGSGSGGGGGGGGSGGSGLAALASPNPAASITSPTPEKPDTILVLKNLPFSLKQDQLQEILMMMNTTAPQSINLHFDNMGVFRGMAFIKYRLLDDAIKVYEALNGYDVGGRKVRVEYKRKNKGQQQPVDVPVEWQEEEDLRKLWEQVKDFSNNPNVNEISFTPNLTSNQRKQIHTMAEKLKLTHYSNGEGEQRYICIKKPPPTTSPTPTSSSFSSSNNNSTQNGFAVPIPTNGAIDIKGRRPRRDSDSANSATTPRGHGHGGGGGSPNAGGGGGGGSNGSHHGNGNGTNTNVGSVEGKSDYNRLPRSSFAKQKEVASSAPADINMDWRSPNSQTGNNINNSNVNQISSSPAQSPSLSGVTIAPSRQPKGPDGSKGFSDMYKSARKNSNSFLPENAAVQEIQAVV